jgi:hypothetical protein
LKRGGFYRENNASPSDFGARPRPPGGSGGASRLRVRARCPGPGDLPCRVFRCGHRGAGRDLHRRSHGDQLHPGIFYLELRRRLSGRGGPDLAVPLLRPPRLRRPRDLRGPRHRPKQHRRECGLPHARLFRGRNLPHGGAHAGTLRHSRPHGASVPHFRPISHGNTFGRSSLGGLRRRGLRRGVRRRPAASVPAPRPSGGGRSTLDHHRENEPTPGPP